MLEPNKEPNEYLKYRLYLVLKLPKNNITKIWNIRIFIYPKYLKLFELHEITNYPNSYFSI